MKKGILFLLMQLVVYATLLSQIPQTFSYQAVARNASGQPLPGQIVGIRFTLTDANSNLLYYETHVATTDDLGLFSLSIGGGDPQGGDFQTIDWSEGNIALRVEIDPSGGDNYMLDGTTILESVPFALQAHKAQPSGSADGDLGGEYPAPAVVGLQNRAVSAAAPAVGDVLKWNGNSWAPGTDATSGGGSFSAGTGISISGNIISNTGDLSTTNELQTISISGAQLSISNGNSVTLPTGTTYSAGSGINITGNTISANDASTSNELQSLSVSGAQLSISNGNSVTLPTGTTYTAGSGINITGNTISANDASTSNELQSLSLSGSQLSISNGNSVTLPTGTTYTAGSGINITGNTISANDASATNEIQSISLSGSQVNLSNGGGSITLPDASATNEIQSISLSGSSLTLSNGGGSVTIDPNATNEIQSLSLSGQTLSLSNGGGSVTLPSATGHWDLIGSDIVANNTGKVGIGTSSPAAQLHVQNSISSTEAIRISGSNTWLSFYEGSLYDGFLWNNSGTITLGTSHVNQSGKLKFFTNGAERMVLNATGNVGIGTLSPVPDYRLHVENASGSGIHGKSINSYGIYGYSGGGIGIYGYSNSPGSAGIFGQSAYIGVEGITNVGSTDPSRQGIRGDNHGSATGWAAYFFGNAGVSGTFSKGGGSFKIDHPLDPENKYLYHSFVESPDMKNIYDGVVITDEEGLAEVQLPEWFDALNEDFRYQLTVIGQFAQAIVSQKIADNRFVIRTDIPGVEVSWQVTGIRKDPFAQQHRIPVEEDKPADKKGKYLHPFVYGKSIEQAVDYLPINHQVNQK